MFYRINSLPFVTYIFILLFFVVGSVYAIFDMRKKRTGHPMIWIFPFIILEGISLFVYRCSIEFTTNAVFQKVAHVFANANACLFFIAFAVTFIIAHKKNYTNKKRLKELLPLMIGCVIIVIICCISIALRQLR